MFYSLYNEIGKLGKHRPVGLPDSFGEQAHIWGDGEDGKCGWKILMASV